MNKPDYINDDCLHPNDTISVSSDTASDKDYALIYVTMSTFVQPGINDNWFTRQWKKLLWILELIIKGELEYENTVMYSVRIGENSGFQDLIRAFTKHYYKVIEDLKENEQ